MEASRGHATLYYCLAAPRGRKGAHAAGAHAMVARAVDRFVRQAPSHELVAISAHEQRRHHRSRWGRSCYAC